MSQETIESPEEPKLRYFIDAIAAGRWWVFTSTLIFTVGFTAYAFLSSPIYRSNVVLMPETADKTSLSGSLNTMLGQAGGLVSLLGGGPGTADAPTEEALAVLRSREFTERFIDEQGLLPKFFPRRWDKEHKRWKDPGRIPTLGRGYQYFDNYVRSIQQDKKTGLTILQIDWTDRTEASNWANEMIRELNEEMRARAIAKADASVAFLEKELAATSTVETRNAIDHLIESQEKQRMIANVSHEYAFQVVDKALPADLDDPIKPKKELLITLGVLLGLAVGIGAVLLRRELSR